MEARMPQGSRIAQPEKWYFRSPTEGLRRTLSIGVVTHVVCGDRVMLSFVEIEPHTSSPVHSHPEEQWGYLIAGTCVRIQGDEQIEMAAGDFWFTPANVPHAVRTGSHSARILDIFSPPRSPYVTQGAGFGTADADRNSGERQRHRTS